MEELALQTSLSALCYWFLLIPKHALGSIKPSLSIFTVKRSCLKFEMGVIEARGKELHLTLYENYLSTIRMSCWLLTKAATDLSVEIFCVISCPRFQKESIAHWRGDQLNCIGFDSSNTPSAKNFHEIYFFT